MAFKVMRLIFRLDFKLAPALVDSPGTVLSMLIAREASWPRLSENRNDRGIRGEYNSGDETINGAINITPTTINGHFDDWNGINLDEVAECDYLTEINKLIAELADKIGLKHFERIGLRAYIFDFESSDLSKAVLPRFLDKQFFSQYQTVIGTSNDAACILQGITNDGVGYRMQTGPYGLDDRKRLFAEYMDKRKLDEKDYAPHRFMIDLDLFERSVQLPNDSFTRWSRTKWKIASEIATLLAQEAYGVD